MLVDLVDIGRSLVIVDKLLDLVESYDGNLRYGRIRQVGFYIYLNALFIYRCNYKKVASIG